jgi:hypothetical protein
MVSVTPESMMLFKLAISTFSNLQNNVRFNEKPEYYPSGKSIVLKRGNNGSSCLARDVLYFLLDFRFLFL